MSYLPCLRCEQQLMFAKSGCAFLKNDSIRRRRGDASLRRDSGPPKADHWIHISKATVPLLCTSFAAECNGWVRGHFLRWCWLGLRVAGGCEPWNATNPERQPDRGLPSLLLHKRTTNSTFGLLAANLALGNVRPHCAILLFQHNSL